MSKAEEPSTHLTLFYSETVNIIRVANLTANTKNYEQITLKTKPRSAPTTTFILLDMETFCHLRKCWYTVIGKHKIILPSPYTDLYSICGFQTDFKSMRPFFPWFVSLTGTSVYWQRALEPPKVANRAHWITGEKPTTSGNVERQLCSTWQLVHQPFKYPVFSLWHWGYPLVKW